jgi:hypothetical protein
MVAMPASVPIEHGVGHLVAELSLPLDPGGDRAVYLRGGDAAGEDEAGVSGCLQEADDHRVLEAAQQRGGLLHPPDPLLVEGSTTAEGDAGRLDDVGFHRHSERDEFVALGRAGAVDVAERPHVAGGRA